MNDLSITEYKNIRVLTTQQIAEAYEADQQVVTNNFNRNRERYTEGKHFICLIGSELKEYRAKNQNDVLPNANKFYLWTEKGAFLHAKSLNTDKAWEVYDRLVDTYFKKIDMLEGTSSELQAIIMHDKKIQQVETRVGALEDTMVIDYGQQRVLCDRVNETVVKWLGGKTSNAYREMSKKVFSECNKDFQHYFNVNSRNNTPRKNFDAAVMYIKQWEPCNNTKLLIRDCNAQMRLDA